MKHVKITAPGADPRHLTILEEEFDRHFSLTPELTEALQRLNENATFRFLAGLDAPVYSESPLTPTPTIPHTPDALPL